jgi:hypothetical protein
VRRQVGPILAPSIADGASADSLAIPTPSAALAKKAHRAYLASQDMCDAHQVVVNDIGEVICRPLIGFEDDEIVICSET